jgi:SAM-dependent methyltransferase
MSKTSRDEVFVNILRDVGAPVDRETRILDLGCGAGKMVKAARAKGMSFYGSGMGLRDAHSTADKALIDQGVLREIPADVYRLPFDDSFFDVVVSDMVFEHVMDYPTTLREIHRVLKPGGVFLHIFAPRWMPVEPHIFVPLANMVHARWWLRLWALLGVRNEFQKKLSAAETVEANLKFLTTRTNYLPKRELRRLFAEHYTDVQFVETAFLKNSARGRKIYPVTRWFPFLTTLYGATCNRVAFGRRPLPAAAMDSQRYEAPAPVRAAGTAFASRS